MQSTVAQKPVSEKSSSSDSAHVNEIKNEPENEVRAETGVPVFLQRVISLVGSSPPQLTEQPEDIETQSRQAADLQDDTTNTGATTESQQQNEAEQPPEGATTEDLPSEGGPAEADRIDTEDTNQKAQQQQQEYSAKSTNLAEANVTEAEDKEASEQERVKQTGSASMQELASEASNDTDETDAALEPTRVSSAESEVKGTRQQTEDTQTQQQQTSESSPNLGSDPEGAALSDDEEGLLELAGHHGTEGTPEAMASENDLLSTPEISLAGDASRQINRINSNSTESANLVAVEASAKRKSIAAYFAGKHAAVSGVLDNNIAGVADFVDQKRASASEWLLSKLVVVQTAAFSLVARSIAIGTSITSAIQRGVSAIITPLVSSFRAVSSRVLGIAQSIPIPDIPGLGRVRRAVLSAARRITSALLSALRSVQNFVQRAVGAVLTAIQNLIARVGAAILNVVTRFLSSIMRAIALINNQLAALKQQILSILGGIRNRVYSLFRRMETAAIAQIDRAELRARARIESNRRQGIEVILQILEFSYDNSDYPADDANHQYMDATDNAASKEELDSAARTAMNITSEQVAAQNATVVEEFRQETSSIISVFFSDIAAFVNDIWTRIRQGFAEFSTAVTHAIADLIQNVSTIVTQIYSGLHGMIASLMSKLRSVITIIIDVVRVPITALSNIIRSAINAVSNFFRGIVSSLVNIFSSGASSNGMQDISSATGPLDRFQFSRLLAVARMALLPLAAGTVLVGLGALIAEATAATLALIITILFRVAVVFLIIAIIVLIYLLISRALSKSKAVQKARSRVKPGSRNQRRDMLSKQATPFFLQRKQNQIENAEQQDAAIQSKLNVGKPNDEFEQEADKVADQVMRMPNPDNAALSNDEKKPDVQPGLNTPIYLQRMSGEYKEADSQGALTHQLQAKTKKASAEPRGAVSQALISSTAGKSLSAHVRNQVEPVLGHAMEHVRVHDDAQANEAASSINARAFTHQNDIYLAQGESENDVHLMAHEATHVLQQNKTNTPRISRATKHRETRPSPITRPRIETEVAKSYWEIKVGALFSLMYINSVTTRFEANKEERDAVLSVLWQNKPGQKFNSKKTAIFSIPARSGVKGARDLVYKFVFKPKTRKIKASVEIQFVAEGSAAKVTDALTGTGAPTSGYHDKTYVDLELEQLQSKKKNKLGSITGLSSLPKDEISSVKYAIWQYFKFGNVRKSELDVILPIANTKRSVYYTLRFDAKTNDVEIERIGEAGKAKVKPDELDISRVQDFSKQSKNVATFSAWLKKRYPGVSVSGKTLAELQISINKVLKSDSGKPDWFRKNYGIEILDASTGDTRMDKIHGWPSARRTGIKDYSSSELSKLEMTLQTMSLPVLKHLKSVRMVRQDNFLKKKRNVYVAVAKTYGYTVYKGSDITVLMFDSFINSDKYLFSGGKQGVRSASIGSFAHELGHATDYNAGVASKFNAFVRKEGIKPVSWYGATGKSEAFPEAFAFYHSDPEWMKTNLPKMFAWFETLSTTGKPP